MEEQLDIPNFVLPELPAIGKAAPQLFVDTAGGRKLREPTMEERVNLNSGTAQAQGQGQNKVDLTRSIGEYSQNESRPFTDPTIKFQPGVDVEDMYAEGDPFTYGDAFAKAWDTLKINAFSTFSNVYSGITEGISQGDFSKVWNNSNVDHLADLSENLEKIRPQFRTEDERNNPLSIRNWDSTIKSIIPSLGYAAAGAVDALATTVGITALSALATAPEGGVGAIPGFFVGLAEGGNILKNTITGLWNMSKALNTASKVVGTVEALSAGQKALNISKMVGSSLFFVNSEAALQGELNARQAQKKIGEEHFKRTGEILTQDELEKQTADLQRDTYLLNLPLLAASMAFQVPNLLRGKLVPALIESLPVKLMRDKTLKAGNTALFLTKEWAKESLSEGLEEVGQSIIDDTTDKYYDPYTNRSYMESFVDGTISKMTDVNTAVEFLGGALAGGLMNSVTFLKYSKTKQRAMDAVTAFNSSTNELVLSMSRANHNHVELGKAVANGDMDRVREIHRDNLRDVVETGRQLGSVDAKREIIADMKQMPTGDFNKYTGFNVTPEVQETYVNSLLKEYDNINKILATRDSAFGYNPFIQERWFKERAKSLEPVFGQSAGAVATKMFVDAKKVIGKVMVENNEFGQEISDLETKRPDLSSWYAEDINERIREKVANIRALNLPSDSAMIQSLENKPLVQQAAILSASEGHTEVDREHIRQVVKARAAKKFYELKLKSFSSKAGQKRLLQEIGHYMEFLYGVPTSATATTITTTNPTNPTVATATPNVAPAVNTPIATPANTTSAVNPIGPVVQPTTQPTTPVATTPVVSQPVAPTVAEEDNILFDGVAALEGQPSVVNPRVAAEKYLSDLARTINDNGNQPWLLGIGRTRIIIRASTNSISGYKYEIDGRDAIRESVLDVLQSSLNDPNPYESRPLNAPEYVETMMKDEEQREEIDVFFESQPEEIQFMKENLAYLQDSGLIKIECNG